MSESKFTPGPWQFGTFAAGLLVINESIGKHSPVAQVGSSDLRHIDDNDYANAQLISAAPELLEAAQSVIAAWDIFIDSFNYQPGIGDKAEDLEFMPMMKLRAAINRATT